VRRLFFFGGPPGKKGRPEGEEGLKYTLVEGRSYGKAIGEGKFSHH